MAENTKIEWAHHTFNPWEGCTKVGPGCDNCYAETRNARFGGGTATNWGPGAPRRRTSAGNWAKPLRWNREAERLGIRYRVFCASLADVFDNEVPIEWLVDLLDLIRRTPNIDWLLLTKRIGNWEGRVRAVIARIMADDSVPSRAELLSWVEGWLGGGRPPLNVWLGATVVNQQEADRDIPKLLGIPARVRWLSMEPLLGPVDFRKVPGFNRIGLDLSNWWVIVGGESGTGARPMHPDWARSLRDQCQAAGVPMLFKQWGEWAPGEFPAWPENADYATECGKGWWCPETRVWMERVGKKAAGRLLDGQLWDQYPEGQPS